MLYTRFVPTGNSRWAVFAMSTLVAKVNLVRGGYTVAPAPGRPLRSLELAAISAFAAERTRPARE